METYLSLALRQISSDPTSSATTQPIVLSHVRPLLSVPSITYPLFVLVHKSEPKIVSFDEIKTFEDKVEEKLSLMFTL